MYPGEGCDRFRTAVRYGVHYIRQCSPTHTRSYNCSSSVPPRKPCFLLIRLDIFNEVSEELVPLRLLCTILAHQEEGFSLGVAYRCGCQGSDALRLLERTRQIGSVSAYRCRYEGRILHKDEQVLLISTAIHVIRVESESGSRWLDMSGCFGRDVFATPTRCCMSLSPAAS